MSALLECQTAEEYVELIQLLESKCFLSSFLQYTNIIST